MRVLVQESVTLPRFTNDKLRGYAFVHFGENQAGEKSAGRVIATMPTGVCLRVCVYGSVPVCFSVVRVLRVCMCCARVSFCARV